MSRVKNENGKLLCFHKDSNKFYEIDGIREVYEEGFILNELVFAGELFFKIEGNFTRGVHSGFSLSNLTKLEKTVILEYLQEKLEKQLCN